MAGLSSSKTPGRILTTCPALTATDYQWPGGPLLCLYSIYIAFHVCPLQLLRDPCLGTGPDREQEVLACPKAP